MFFDTHCHIQFKGMDDVRDDVIRRAREAGVLMNLVGTQKETSKLAVELAMKHDDMWATLGTHPNHVFPTYMTEEETSFMTREEDFDVAYYESLYQMAPEKIIGIGETGIDFFHIPPEDEVPFKTVMEKQKQVFLDHWKFAREHGLSMVIHVRDPKPDKRDILPSAHDVLIELLQFQISNFKFPLPVGVVHCYSGNMEQAEKYTALGFHLGFTGVITYPTRKSDPIPDEALQEVIRNVPLDKIVVETDAPFLAPQKYRGAKNEPSYVVEVVKYIAEIREVSVDELEKQVFANTKRLFPKISLSL